jgi:hypothetical protein
MANPQSCTLSDVEAFLNSVSARPPTRVCKKCGFVMRQVEATVSLWSGDRSWSILLPICPKCDPVPTESTVGSLEA